MKGDMAAIRYRYRVAAYRGRRVIVDGRKGTITSADGVNQYLRVRFDGDGQRSVPCHPTWRVDYDSLHYGIDAEVSDD